MKALIVALFCISLGAAVPVLGQVSVGVGAIQGEEYGHQHCIDENGISPLVIYPLGDAALCSLVLGPPKHGELYKVILGETAYFFPALTTVYYDSSLGVVVILDTRWSSLRNSKASREQIDADIAKAFVRLQAFLARVKKGHR